MPDELGIGSWAEWRLAVLGDLKRLGEDVRHGSAEIRALAMTVELLRAAALDADALEKRVSALEAKSDLGEQKNEDRKWLIGLGVLVVASIAFPSLRVLLFGGGG